MVECKCKKSDTVYVKLSKSTRKNKKLMTEYFHDKKEQKPYKTVHFGDSRYSDFTQTQDEKKKELYYKRHNKMMTCPKSANTLAKMILWNKSTVGASFNDYLKKYNYKKY